MMGKLTTTMIYVQQEQQPGGWVDHASTDDREVALGRYKSLAASNPRATRLIERTERVVVEGAPQRKRSR
jgi:hypothetical protein